MHTDCEHSKNHNKTIKVIGDSNGYKYVGKIENGKRNGKGIMYFADGGKYDG